LDELIISYKHKSTIKNADYYCQLGKENFDFMGEPAY